MGSCNFKSDIEESTVSVSKSMFQFQFVIGKGGYGKVWKVEMKKTRENFAMKEMSKAKVIAKKSVMSVLNERRLLTQLKHNFLVNMHYAFQDRENLYLVMDLMPGGDLRFHMSSKVFTEQECKFYISCILIGLEYMHSNLVIHRDIKPENLVFDDKGYLHITDLGISRIWNADNAKETSGTPGYMSPEVMCRQNHGVAADYFAVGVIGYEMMMKSRPYRGKSRKEIRDQILAKQVQVGQDEIPEGWSVESADFINKVTFTQLIKRKPIHRLGLNGPEEVKSHPWLKDINWKKMLSMQAEPPYKPKSSIDNFENRVSITDSENNEIEESAKLTEKEEKSVNDLFSEYLFNIQEDNSGNSKKK